MDLVHAPVVSFQTPTLAETDLGGRPEAGAMLARTTRLTRPGNILGPGSPTWVAGPAQRLLEARPVAVAGIDGFSNAAFAPNLADYLARVVETPAAALSGGICAVSA